MNTLTRRPSSGISLDWVASWEKAIFARGSGPVRMPTRLLSELREISLQAYALCFSALGFVLLGEFSLGGRSGVRKSKKSSRRVLPEFKAMQLIVQCLLANHQGDFGKAESLVEKLQAEIEKHGFLYMIPWTYEISGYLRAVQGKFSEAEKIGKQYLSAAISLKNGLFKGLAFRLLGLIYLHENDFGKAREAIDQSMRCLFKRSSVEIPPQPNQDTSGPGLYSPQRI